MANGLNGAKLKKWLTANMLTAVGVVLYMAGDAMIIGEFVAAYAATLKGIGALLAVAGGLMSIYNLATHGR